jgi:hypothetical protein
MQLALLLSPAVRHHLDGAPVVTVASADYPG